MDIHKYTNVEVYIKCIYLIEKSVRIVYIEIKKSISNQKVYIESKKSISNRKVYIEKSIRNVYTIYLYLIEKSISKCLYLIEKSIRNVYI